MTSATARERSSSTEIEAVDMTITPNLILERFPGKVNHVGKNP